MLLGSIGGVVWLAVGGVGLSLGIALRLLGGNLAAADGARSQAPTSPKRRALEGIGFALNVLEIPAIMLAAADFMHSDIGDDKQAAKKYRRIVKLFPTSNEAKIAQSRLAELVISNQEG